MPNTVGPWGSSSSGVNTIPGTPTPLATVTSATWGGIGGSITSQADLQTALAAKASLSGATFTGTVQSTGGLWSVTAAGVANFTSITSGVNWGGITGSSPQPSPSGGWSTAATFASSVSMGALTLNNNLTVSSGSVSGFTQTTSTSPIIKFTNSANTNRAIALATDGSFAGIQLQNSGTSHTGIWSDGASIYMGLASTSNIPSTWGTATVTINASTGAITSGVHAINSGSTLQALSLTSTGGTYFSIDTTSATAVSPAMMLRSNGTGYWQFGLYGGTAGNKSFFIYDNVAGDNVISVTSGTGGLIQYSTARHVSMGALTATVGATVSIIGAGTGSNFRIYHSGGTSVNLSNSGGGGFSFGGSLGDTSAPVAMGALTATTGLFTGTVQFSNGYTEFADRAVPGTFNSRYLSRSGNSLMWRYDGSTDGELLHTGNVGTNAATLQAAVASATAPMVGTHAQMIAFGPAVGSTPYWYATDDLETDGLYGKLWKWNGSSWVAVGTPSTIAGRITAGVISAGAIGAQALAADVALIGQVLRSTGFTAGTTTAAPTGFKMSGTAFTSYCYNGDTTGIYSTSLSSYMEIGSGCSLGGYALGSLVLGRLINAGMKVYSPGTYTWVCPPGITQVVVTLSGGGGSGCHDASNPGAGGGAGCLTVISSVTPGTSYTVVCGAGGAGTSTTSGNDGGNSTFNGLTAQGGAAGYTGGGGYGGGAGPLGQMTSGNGVMAQMATGAVYIMCGQGARGGGGGTDPGSTQWQTGTGFGVGGGSSAAGPGYGSGSDGKTSGSTTAGGQGVVILSW